MERIATCFVELAGRCRTDRVKSDPFPSQRSTPPPGGAIAPPHSGELRLSRRRIPSPHDRRYIA